MSTAAATPVQIISGTGRISVTEETLPAGTPVIVEHQADGRTVVRTDPAQIHCTPAENRADLTKIRDLIPGAMAVASALLAVDDLAVLTAEHGAQVETRNTDTMPDSLRDDFIGWYTEIDGKPTLVFPAGQDPIQRLAVAKTLLAHAERAR